MIFSVNHDVIARLPYRTRIDSRFFLDTTWPLSLDTIQGYQLGICGGNYVKIKQVCPLRLEFSFFKDFDLKQDLASGVLLTNDPTCTGHPLSSDIVAACLQDGVMVHSHFDWKSLFGRPTCTSRQVTDMVRDRLLANLNQLRSISSSTYIAFTAGLDSGTLCLLAHGMDWPFTAVINDNHRGLYTVPFAKIVYEKSSVLDDLLEQKHVRESFYQSYLSNIITGFFGDLTLLHNGTLFQQCGDLLHLDALEVYDPKAAGPGELFKHPVEIWAAVRKMFLTTRFRQWFPEFVMLDPYRDPELTAMIMSMDLVDQIRQFGTAFVQKDICRSLDPNYQRYFCREKNDYSCFS